MNNKMENFPRQSLISTYMHKVALRFPIKEDYDCKIVLAPKISLDNFFLTIIIRTQGYRAMMLKEVLLCLMGQDSKNFAIIISGHNLDEKRINSMLELVNLMPNRFIDRVALINTEGGNRSRPLNSALGMVKSPYFAILDDDDLVFSNWVSAFESRSKDSFGKIIHSGVYTQEWYRCNDGSSGEVTESIGAPRPTFCSSYDPILQFRDNMCPIMSVAYPSFLVSDLGFRFDENLSTLEDWDFLQRSAIVCGVEDSHKNTAIYRLWTNSDASHNIHGETEWEKNRINIEKKFDSIPILLPPGSLQNLRNLMKLNQAIQIDSSRSKLECLRNDETKFFIDSYDFEYDYETKINKVRFELQEYDEIKRITFLPTSNSQVTFIDLSLTVVFENGESTVFQKWDLVGNGYTTKFDEWVFIQQPHIELTFQKGMKIQSCEYSFVYKNYIDDSVLSGTRLMMRLRSSVKRKIYRFRKFFSK